MHQKYETTVNVMMQEKPAGQILIGDWLAIYGWTNDVLLARVTHVTADVDMVYVTVMTPGGTEVEERYASNKVVSVLSQ